MSERRQGEWMETWSGVRFYPLDPRPEEVNIEDIANALSKMCRFGGHSRQFYSVAEHSLWVSYRVPPWLALAGLLHDAHEAYVGDMIRPVKNSIRIAMGSLWDTIEADLQRAITTQLGGAIENDDDARIIKNVDNKALATERRDLRVPTENVWVTDGLEEPMVIMPRGDAGAVAQHFIDRYKTLLGRVVPGKDLATDIFTFGVPTPT